MVSFLIGKKLGMTRVFSDDGRSTAVTVIDVSGNVVVSVKTKERDGYVAVQLGFGLVKRRRRRPLGVSRSVSGHYTRNGLKPRKLLKEVRVDAVDSSIVPGLEVKASVFSAGQKVDVTGVCIGKGFAGVIKRHHFASGPSSHGCSLSHRTPGSTGMNQDPGRVFRGKKMPGHMGDVQRTIQLLEVVRIDELRQLLLIKGAVPGSKGSTVFVRQAVKAGG